MKYKIAILGASGYTGAELVRLIALHADLDIVALTGERKAGQSMASVYPFLRHMNLPDLVRIEEVDFNGVDLVFCALPHATSQSVVRGLPTDMKVVDLSADFRLRDVEAYAKWYGKPHDAPDLQEIAVYGLTEFYRDEISTARLVACTGCNAATGQFGLRPLLTDKVIATDDIVINLITGVSGAGRSLKENLLHAELSEGANPYGFGGSHRHLGEFDQEFSAIAGHDVRVQFTPHLAPMNRGILGTMYVSGDPDAVYQSLSTRYRTEPFVHVLPFGVAPSTHDVRGSNHVHIGVAGDRVPNRVTVFVALDNLTKGSSGMAIQNANLMLDLDERTGLDGAALFP